MIRRVRLVRPLCALAVLAACGPEESPVDEPAPPPLEIGQSRDIELRYLRFDVSNFEKHLTKEDLLALPLDTRRRLWLLDLDVSNGPSSAKLLENALAAMRTIDPATLDVPSRNLQRLLDMTPDTANLRGTKLEAMLDLAPLVGIPPARAFADMLGINVEDTFITPAVLADTLLRQVIQTHPNAQLRLGPKTAANPDGVYAVTPGSLPVMLDDVLTNGATLSDRFGEIWESGVYHPGFVGPGAQLDAITDCPAGAPDDPSCFRITVKVSANALPFKGVDLTNVSGASVNSVPSQLSTLFDFEDPTWLRIQGLVDVPMVRMLPFIAKEADGFVPGGTLPLPYDAATCGVMPCGNSPGWQLAPYTLERVLLSAAATSFAQVDHFQQYYAPSDPDTPLLTTSVADGWQEITVKADLGSPPPPAFLWDVLLEAAQVLLHDGVAEGEADVSFGLRDISLGADSATIEATVRDNLAANPEAFLDVARQVIDTSSGAADFYYYIADPRTNPPSVQGDYLVFVAEGDIATDDAGTPERPYAYARPGFYADEALTEKLSTTGELDGDTAHEKVKLAAGDVLYVEDDQARVFQITVGDKPTDRRRVFTITRVR